MTTGFWASSVLRAWAFAVAGLVGPVVLQFGYLIIAARALPVSTFGNFLLLISVIAVVWSFAGFGAGGVTLKVIARNPGEAVQAFGKALALTLLTLPVLLPIVAIAGAIVTHGGLPPWVLVAVAAVELTFARMTQTCSSLFIGRAEQGQSSLMLLTTPLARLLAAAITLAWPPESRFVVFVLLYCVAAVVSGCFCVSYVASKIGRPVLAFRGYRVWDGFTFALTDLNSALQTETDKVLLGLLATPNAVAVYAIASRLMDGAIMPSRALRMVMHSRLFYAGGSGLHGSLSLTRKMLPLVVGYGVLAWIGFVVAAPFFAWLFGPGYERLGTILPILGVLPLLRAVTELAAEVFITSDRPGLQVSIQMLGFLARVALGLVLISQFVIDGAIATSLLVTATMAGVLWWIALSSSKEDRRGTAG